ncbi:Cytochrome c2 [Monaibacterium marinum]|uniref:Cytochrome c2 n=1 Tax=Pontivivens marinum TaxID=1690039 RepID=A0A2C9CMR0_9RHOB|nr:c-type cytochrome [Monaibacterium marinum]SOH92512.1 Cytochrome c2 [Monaibacterium marinum]
MGSLEFQKIFASVIGAFLALLLFTWVGDLVYGLEEGGHGDEHHLAYEIELPEGDVAEVAVDEGPSIGELLVTASAESGEGLFRPCTACHSATDESNKTGPYLLNVVGRDIASVDSFGGYSDALTSLEGAWTAEALSAFIESPRAYAPGTGMSYSGMRRAADRADVIAYLVSTSGQNLEDFIVLPEAAPVEEAATEEAPVEEAEANDEAAPATEGEAEATEAAPAAEVEEAPVEEAPAEAAPAEEAPVEEAAPVTEAPVEEAPAEEAAPEVVEEEEEAAAEPVVEEAVTETAATDLPEFMVNASAEDGRRAFRPCMACHTLDEGANRVGPSLYNVVNNDIASVEGFRYSSAMAELEGNWTYEKLNTYLEAPRSTVPGTRMAFAGVRSQQDRANLIAFLETSGQ